MAHREIFFGKNLRILRSQHSITQEELADAIHVTRQTISIWEQNRGKPDIYALDTISNFFNVPLDRIMYEKVIEFPYSDHETNEPEMTYESDLWIKNYCRGGLYTIIDEDLENFFDLISYDFETISVIELELHRQGYILTEVFDNGFSICFRNDEEAKSFPKNLYVILDCLIHKDNPKINEHYDRVTRKMNEARYEIIFDVEKELWGKRSFDFAYYWIDCMENLRGHADTKEECVKQANEQGCDDYMILPLT